jgi:hypothetical protein
VDVGDLLELLRALAGHRPAAAAPDEQHARARREVAGDLRDLVVQLQDFL